jgi:hypothetical protein
MDIGEVDVCVKVYMGRAGVYQLCPVRSYAAFQQF